MSDSVSLDWLVNYASNLLKSQDHIHATAVDRFGNIYVTGESDSTLSSIDYMTIKYSPAGTMLWKRRYASEESDFDIPYAITVDRQGNVCVTGSSLMQATRYDFTTVKYDSSGNILWIAQHDGPDHGDDLATCIAVDATGNVFVAGGTQNTSGTFDYLMVKYNSLGVEEWSQRYDGPGHVDDAINSLALDRSGNVYVTGFSNSLGSADAVTIRYSSDGSLGWIERYDGIGGGRDEGMAIKVSSEGNIFVTGDTYNGLDADFLTIKYDSTGNEVWTRLFGVYSQTDDKAVGLDIDKSENVCVGGSTWSATNQFSTVKYSPNGIQLWAHTETPAKDAFLYSIAFDPSGNVIVAGAMAGWDNHSNSLIIKYSSTGTNLWYAQYRRPSYSYFTTTLVVDSAGDIILGGGGEFEPDFDPDFAVLKYSSVGSLSWIQEFNGTGYSHDEVHGVKADNFGHAYVLIDNEQSEYATLVKYSSEGESLWVRKYKNFIIRYGFDLLVIDSSGNAYLAGNDSVAHVTLLKVSPAGNLIWERHHTLNEAQYETHQLQIDDAGYIYVGGHTGYGGGIDYFILKYNPEGNIVWASERINYPNLVVPLSGTFALDKNKNIAVTGYYVFQTIVTVLDSSGSTKWIRTIAGSSAPAVGVAFDDSGNVFVVDRFNTAMLTPDGTQAWTVPRGGLSFAVTGGGDVFLANLSVSKLGHDGTLIWSQPPPLTLDGGYVNVYANPCGEVYAAGSGLAASAGNPTSVCVSRMTATGVVNWTVAFNPFGGWAPSEPRLTFDPSGQLYVGSAYNIGNGRMSAAYLAKLHEVPTLTLDKDTLDLGEVSMTCGESVPITLSSTICASARAYSVSITDSAFSVTELSSSSEIGSAHEYAITFTSTSEGSRSCTISFHYANSSASVYVKGTGLTGYPQYFNTHLDFGNTTVGCVGPDSLTIKNQRCEALSGRILLTDSLNYGLYSDSIFIPSQDSARMGVNFTPRSVGLKMGSLILKHNQSAEADTISIFGNGVGSGLEVSVIDSLGIGWRMLSMPVRSACPAVLRGSYLYERIYKACDTLEVGVGYWNKLNKAKLIWAGDPIVAETLQVGAYWNLIGSISTTIPLSQISSDPPGIVTSQIFGFDGTSYRTADSIRPGKAYWIKSNQSGSLFLTSVPSASFAKIKIVQTAELPPAPPSEATESDPLSAPKAFALTQNYPNPFNPATTFRYQIPNACHVQLRIYDVVGREVATLVNDMKGPGDYSATWDASSYSSGVYFYKLEAGSYSEVKKLVLIR